MPLEYIKGRGNIGEWLSICQYFPCHIIVLYSAVDGERFAGLNIRSSGAIEVFTEILLHYLGHKCSLFSTIKEKCFYSQKNFHGIPETEKRKRLAQ